MAKIKAPLFSLDATGTLDKNITYKKKLQDNIAQKYSQPGAKNPFESSPRQKDQRSIIRLITIHWQCMSSADQLSWNNAAKDARFKGTGYHYFLSKAQQNLTQYLGLVGYWSMNYNVDDKIPDLSGNGNHGILSPIYPCDSPTLVNSFNKINGKALFLNGTSNYLALGHDPDIDITSALSIEFNMTLSNLNPPSSDSSIILRYLDAGVGNRKYWVSYRAATGQKGIAFYIVSDTNVLITKYQIDWAPQLNKWYHIVVIYKPSTYLRTYIDGSLAYESTSGIPSAIQSTPTIDIFLGKKDGSFYPGNIDNMLIWDRVLELSEILKHYEYFS